MLKLQECAASENLAAYVKDFETEHKAVSYTHLTLPTICSV